MIETSRILTNIVYAIGSVRRLLIIMKQYSH